MRGRDWAQPPRSMMARGEPATADTVRPAGVELPAPPPPPLRLIDDAGTIEQALSAPPAPPAEPNTSPGAVRTPVVLVHDYLLVLRGAERTFAAIAGCWPTAPVATLVYDPALVAERFAGRELRSSGLQRLPVRQLNFRALLPVYPWAARHLPVGDASLIVSSSSAFAHGVRPGPGAIHVCYCHSPFRYAWHAREGAMNATPAVVAPAMRWLQHRLRDWDQQSTRGVTHYIANSRLTQQRIYDFWGRESTVIHPPVAVERFAPEDAEDYFLFVGELVAHKQADLALTAARLAGRPIKVVGTGPELQRLQAKHGEHAEFVGRVGDEALEGLLARCRALIVPNVEDFGIASVEAQASGRPVVAARGGGSLETVRDGETGILFPAGDTGALAEILSHTDFDRFSSARAVEHARSFATDRFQAQLRGVVATAIATGAGTATGLSDAPVGLASIAAVVKHRRRRSRAAP